MKKRRGVSSAFCPLSISRFPTPPFSRNLVRAVLADAGSGVTLVEPNRRSDHASKDSRIYRDRAPRHRRAAGRTGRFSGPKPAVRRTGGVATGPCPRPAITAQQRPQFGDDSSTKRLRVGQAQSLRNPPLLRPPATLTASGGMVSTSSWITTETKHQMSTISSALQASLPSPYHTPLAGLSRQNTTSNFSLRAPQTGKMVGSRFASQVFGGWRLF